MSKIFTPEYERKEQKILDIFLKMNWVQQYAMATSLRIYADQSYKQAKAVEREAATCRTSTKIIQFPAVAPR